MRKLFFLVLLSSIISMIFISCNKDDGVSSNTGGTTPTTVTQTFKSTPNKNIDPGLNSDSLNAIITLGIDANNISDVKLVLDSLEDVTVSNLRFSLVHNGTEVMVIDYLTNVSGQGDISNLILSDSMSSNPIMGVNSYPITGTYGPLNPLSGFDNLEASGYWTLKINNSGSLRTGVIKSWGITITYNKVQPPTTVLMPLAVGNKWVYTMDSSGVTLPEDTLLITNTALYNGKTVYQLYESRKPNNEMYLGYENSDLWGYSIIQNISRLMFKYPVNVGEWWIGGGSGDSTVCLSTNETVVTPSGTYTGCIKYQSFDRPYDYSIDYFKPGVGLVGTDKSGRIQRLKAFNPPPAVTQIFPTAVGNTWKLEGRTAQGNIYGYDTLRITETMLYQGKTLYRVIDYENPNDSMYVNIESDGAYIWSKFGGSTFGSQLMWKYPVNVGEIYIGGGNGDTVKCLSVNETVTTPSGTYTGCIKYEFHDSGAIWEYFYMKPGIGIVGIDHLQNGDYERLFSYHLNK